MKIRNGFVSNSSSSSFVCDICGETFEGWDASPYDDSFDVSVCHNDHIVCNEHLKVDPVRPTVEGCERQRASRSAAPHCSAPLSTIEARYRDLLQRLGCCSHDGAIKEIASLRRHAELDKPNINLTERI